jgi:serine/threonine-protein kinase RsbW
MTVMHVGSGNPSADGDSVASGSSPQEPVMSVMSVMSIEMRTMANAIAIPTIRTVAADLAARADFDLDSIDDLRMAVDDVCAMLVQAAAEGGVLSCKFTVFAERIELVAEVDADHLVDPLPTGSFDRRVLESLVDEVSGLFLPSVPGPSLDSSGLDQSGSDDGSPLALGRRGRVRITLTKGTLIAPPP